MMAFFIFNGVSHHRHCHFYIEWWSNVTDAFITVSITVIVMWLPSKMSNYYLPGSEPGTNLPNHCKMSVLISIKIIIFIHWKSNSHNNHKYTPVNPVYTKIEPQHWALKIGGFACIILKKNSCRHHCAQQL